MKIKKEFWCDMCHNKYDCEDKEIFLKSNEEMCDMYA